MKSTSRRLVVGMVVLASVALLIIWLVRANNGPDSRSSIAEVFQPSTPDRLLPGEAIADGMGIPRSGADPLLWSQSTAVIDGRACLRLAIADQATDCAVASLVEGSSQWNHGRGPEGSWFFTGVTTTRPAEMIAVFADGRREQVPDRHLVALSRGEGVPTSPELTGFSYVSLDEMVGFEFRDAEGRVLLSGPVYDQADPPRL